MFGTFFIVPFSWEWKIIQKVTWLIFFRGVSSNHQPDLLRQSVSIRLLRRRNEVIRISRISRFQGFSGSFFWISYVLSVQSFKARKLQGIHDIYKPICNHSIIIQTIIIYIHMVCIYNFNHSIIIQTHMYIYIYNSHSKSQKWVQRNRTRQHPPYPPSPRGHRGIIPKRPKPKKAKKAIASTG